MFHPWRLVIPLVKAAPLVSLNHPSVVQFAPDALTLHTLQWSVEFEEVVNQYHSHCVEFAVAQ